ncbi:MAG: MmcQ/YjbR family DNA-binding protein [Saprospiraceae bacterium]|nr:MmcQ/YjbR family DNA-binding protein [Saprospiraceae bacterium]
MDIEALRLYCLSKKAVTEGLPFGETTLVFKVVDKIFALTSLDTEGCRVNLKCDPERAIDLREQHPDHILAGYHMNKKHWNTVICDEGLNDGLIRELIDHSYDLVVKSLPKVAQAALLT